MIREREYEPSNLNYGFFRYAERRFENFPKKEWHPMKEGQKTKFTARYINYSIFFEQDDTTKELYLQIEAEARKTDLSRGDGDEKGLLEVLHKIQKWDFLGEAIVERCSFNRAYAHLKVKRKVKMIPLGKKGHISDNLHKSVFSSMVGVIDDYLHRM